ncbi:MAG: dihydropteroate synthase [Flavobacteriales bacterium]
MNKFHTLRLNGRLLSLENPVVMAILNITPDSFYDKSRVENNLLKRCENMLSAGATLLDIGGQSTRPGAGRVDADEELKRVIPAIHQISKEFPDALISVDTFYSSVAKAAVENGACMINDISAGSIDPEMFGVVASLHVPYVLMHMQGTPETMQINPSYEQVISEITYFFSERIHQLHLLGVRDIILDPGFGFGKSLSDNYRILHHFAEFGILDKPVLAGLSRKGMIQKVIHADAENALNATTAANMIALMHGARILRVHDVKEAAETIAIFNAMQGAQ